MSEPKNKIELFTFLNRRRTYQNDSLSKWFARLCRFFLSPKKKQQARLIKYFDSIAEKNLADFREGVALQIKADCDYAFRVIINQLFFELQISMYQHKNKASIDFWRTQVLAAIQPYGGAQ